MSKIFVVSEITIISLNCTDVVSTSNNENGFEETIFGGNIVGGITEDN